jgi:hypothetical protein
MQGYGVALGVAEAWLAFSLSLAAFCVACCSRIESALRRSASGVDCGFTLVSGLLEREHPVAKMPAARSKSKNLFITGTNGGTEANANFASARR